MLYSRIITGIILFTVLFAQADKGRDHSRSIPKKFNDGFILNPIKNKSQFQSQVNSEEIVHIIGPTGITAFSADNEAIPLLGEPVRRVFSNSSRGTADTLDNGIDYTVNFVFYPGDVMMEVYQAPTELIMYGVGVDVSSWNADGFTPSLKVEVWRPGTGGYPYLSDGTTYPSTVIDGGGWVGYAHPFDNDTIHYPDTSYAAGLVWNGFANGGTCDNDPEPANGQPLMGTKVLPAGNVDYTITNPDDGSTGLYWVDFTPEGAITFDTDEYIAVVVTYLTEGAGDPADGDAGIVLKAGDATAIYPHVGMKYYDQDCEGTSGNHGWHIRHYNWRFAYAVELTGDRGPIFVSINGLLTTLSTENRTITAHITDDNPSGGDAGVFSSMFYYQFDSLTAPLDSATMFLIDGNAEDGIWEGQIPATLGECEYVYWYLKATDINGNSSRTETRYYFIFCPSETNDLIFNNQDLLYGNILYSSYLYFYWGGEPFDIWDASYGPLSSELLEHYTTVIELSGNGGPIYNNDNEIENWWGGDKSYIVVGDEWLGIRYGWDNDAIIPEGDVARTILGVDTYYPDINSISVGNREGISRLMPDSAGFASVLYEFLSDSLLVNYDPYPLHYNWLDGIDPVGGYTVDMTAYSGVLDSANQVDPPIGSEEYNVMIHGQQGNGGRSAFLAFDAIALRKVPYSLWIGEPANVRPLVQAYEDLAAILSVEDDDAKPNAFILMGNFPNPFNPITNIHYELSENTQVKITIYDVLGRKVKNLLNAQQTAGEKTIQWNSKNDLGLPVSAGLYFYKVEAGEFVQTKKMVLLK